MTSNMNHQKLDHDHMVLISQLFPGVYTPIIPQQGQFTGEGKPRRRRRKKNKGGENGSGGAKKRKLSAEQVDQLEQNFGNEHKLESERKDKLASELGLDPRQVAVWFQNRRARWKNKKLEEEYSKLKAAHDSVVVEKCRLESEVLKLKEQLSEAEKTIQRLSERAEGVSNSSHSPSSSLTMEAMDLSFLGESGLVEAYDDVFYLPEHNYIPGMEWMICNYF